MDLWAVGKIYPKVPVINAPPAFSNITSLLHFVGDGKQGMLGYTHLETQALMKQQQLAYLLNENYELKRSSEEIRQKLLEKEATIKELEKKINDLRTKNTTLRPRKRLKNICNIKHLKIGSGRMMKKRVQAIKSRSNSYIFSALKLLFEHV